MRPPNPTCSYTGKFLGKQIALAPLPPANWENKSVTQACPGWTPLASHPPTQPHFGPSELRRRMGDTLCPNPSCLLQIPDHFPL